MNKAFLKLNTESKSKIMRVSKYVVAIFRKQWRCYPSVFFINQTPFPPVLYNRQSANLE